MSWFKRKPRCPICGSKDHVDTRVHDEAAQAAVLEIDRLDIELKALVRWEEPLCQQESIRRAILEQEAILHANT